MPVAYCALRCCIPEKLSPSRAVHRQGGFFLDGLSVHIVRDGLEEKSNAAYGPRSRRILLIQPSRDTLFNIVKRQRDYFAVDQITLLSFHRHCFTDPVTRFIETDIADATVELRGPAGGGNLTNAASALDYPGAVGGAGRGTF